MKLKTRKAPEVAAAGALDFVKTDRRSPMETYTDSPIPTTGTVWLLYTERGSFFSWFSSHELAQASLDLLGAGTIVRRDMEGASHGA